MNIRKYIQATGLVLLGVFGFQQAVFAVGASAGTSIDNQATLSYSVSGVGQTDIDSNTASFLVDNRVNVDVTEVGVLTTGAPGQTQLVTIFNVQNLGNEDQGYTFAASNVAAVDDFDVTITRIAVDLDSSGTVNGAEAWVVGVTTDLLSLAEDASVQVLVEATIPGAATIGQTGLVSLLATTNDDGTTTATTHDNAAPDNPAVVQVVFYDAAGTDDAVNDGQYSARNGYEVATSQITVVKTSTAIRDPVNDDTNPKAIPGAHIQYTIVIENDDAATADAVLATISDVLSANLAFDPDHIVGATGAAQNAAGDGFHVVTGTNACTGAPVPRGIDAFFTTTDADADGADHDGSETGGTVTVDLATVLPADANHAAGELEPCENVTITFNVIVQ